MKIVSSWHLFSRPFQPFKYSVIEKSWWSQQVTEFKMAEERHRDFMHKVSIEACLYGPIKSRRTSIGYIFHFCQNQLSSAYKLPKWSEWSCYDQNIPNRGQKTINIFNSYWRTSWYAVHFFYIFHLCKKQLSCTYQLSKLSKWTCYDQNIPNRRQ